MSEDILKAIYSRWFDLHAPQLITVQALDFLSQEKINEAERQDAVQHALAAVRHTTYLHDAIFQLTRLALNPPQCAEAEGKLVGMLDFSPYSLVVNAEEDAAEATLNGCAQQAIFYGGSYCRMLPDVGYVEVNARLAGDDDLLSKAIPLYIAREYTHLAGGTIALERLTLRFPILA